MVKGPIRKKIEDLTGESMGTPRRTGLDKFIHFFTSHFAQLFTYTGMEQTPHHQNQMVNKVDDMREVLNQHARFIPMEHMEEMQERLTMLEQNLAYNEDYMDSLNEVSATLGRIVKHWDE